MTDQQQSFDIVALNLPIPTNTVAAYCGVDPTVIYRAASKHQIPHTKKGTREYTYQSADLPQIKETIDKLQAARTGTVSKDRKLADALERIEKVEKEVYHLVDGGKHLPKGDKRLIHRVLVQHHDAINELNKVFGQPPLPRLTFDESNGDGA